MLQETHIGIIEEYERRKWSEVWRDVGVNRDGEEDRNMGI